MLISNSNIKIAQYFAWSLIVLLLGIFILMSIYLLFLSITKSKFGYIYIIGAGVLIFCALLTKGFVGLFPLIFFVLHGLIYKKSFKIIVIKTFFLLTIVAICFVLIIALNKEAIFYFQQYYKSHLQLAVLGNETTTVGSRTYIFLKLFLETSPYLLVIALVICFRKKMNILVDFKCLLFFLLIGISASLPLCISSQQRGFYLIPCFPFFIISTSIVLEPLFRILYLKIKKIPLKWLIMPTVVNFIIAISIVFLNFGKVERDHKKLHDVYKLVSYFPPKTIIEVTESLSTDWTLIAYLSRVGVITLSNQLNCKYVLVLKSNDKINYVTYKQIDLHLDLYELYLKTP